MENNKIKDFHSELDLFLTKIKNNVPFSLSRWGDGELMILERSFIDLRIVKNGEFRYDPSLPIYDDIRNQLMESYTHIDENYYIGIACSCCVGEDKFEYMKRLSGQNESNLTWANIFVNSNYFKFLNDYTIEFGNHEIVMVVNHKADTSLLPFNVSKTYKVGTDAWLEDIKVLDEIKSNLKENQLYLIAAGPLANILTYELWKLNKNNTYIDIGSVYDTQMGMNGTRGYHSGAPTLKKKCIW